MRGVLFLLFLANLLCSFITTANVVNKTEETSKAAIFKVSDQIETPSLDKNVAVTKTEAIEGSGSGITGKEHGFKESRSNIERDLTALKDLKKSVQKEEKDLETNIIKEEERGLEGKVKSLIDENEFKVIENSIKEDGKELKGEDKDMKIGATGDQRELKVTENNVKEDEKQLGGDKKDLKGTEKGEDLKENEVKEDQVNFKGDGKDINVSKPNATEVKEESLHEEKSPIKELTAKEEFPIKELTVKEEPPIKELTPKEESPIKELTAKEESPIKELTPKEESPIKEEEKEADANAPTEDQKEDKNTWLFKKHLMLPELKDHPKKYLFSPPSEALNPSEDPFQLVEPLPQEYTPFSRPLSPPKLHRRKSFALDPPSEEWRGSKYDLFSRENMAPRHISPAEYPRRSPPIPTSDPYEEELTYAEDWKQAPRQRYPVTDDQKDWLKPRPEYPLPIQNEPNHWHQNQQYTQPAEDWQPREHFDMHPQLRRQQRPRMDEPLNMQFAPPLPLPPPPPRNRHNSPYAATFQVPQNEQPMMTDPQMIGIGQNSHPPPYGMYPGFIQQIPMGYNQEMKGFNYENLKGLVNPDLYARSTNNGAWRYNIRAF